MIFGQSKLSRVRRAAISISLAIAIGASSACSTALAQRIDPSTMAQVTTLSPKAREAATLLGILPKVERLIEIKKAKAAGGSDVLSDEELSLKVDILDRVMGASLEIRMVGGRIDRELAWAFSGQGMLLGKRQRNLNYLFTANFIQIGILGVLSGPAFLDNHPTTGTKLLLLASSIGLGLSSLAFLEARRGSKEIDGGNTVLGQVFHLESPTPQDHDTEIVTKFLNSVPPSSVTKQSRVETLVEGWKKGHFMRANSSEKSLQKLAAIQPPGKHYRETPGLLSTRIRMLFDTQYTIELLHEELLELLRATEVS